MPTTSLAPSLPAFTPKTSMLVWTVAILEEGNRAQVGIVAKPPLVGVGLIGALQFPTVARPIGAGLNTSMPDVVSRAKVYTEDVPLRVTDVVYMSEGLSAPEEQFESVIRTVGWASSRLFAGYLQYYVNGHKTSIFPMCCSIHGHGMWQDPKASERKEWTEELPVLLPGSEIELEVGAAVERNYGELGNGVRNGLFYMDVGLLVEPVE